MALNILEIGMNHNIALISSFWAANRSCMEHHHMLETPLEMFISIRARYLGDKLIFKVDISWSWWQRIESNRGWNTRGHPTWSSEKQSSFSFFCQLPVSQNGKSLSDRSPLTDVRLCVASWWNLFDVMKFESLKPAFTKGYWSESIWSQGLWEYKSWL